MGQGRPDPIRRSGRAPSVLALHGFGGTPLEVELVADLARAIGLATSAPLLPGHGTHVRDLMRTGYRDWLAAAERSLDELASEASPVIVAGLSMGSLLAVDLCVPQPARICGLILLANATSLCAPFPAWPLECLRRLPHPDFWVPKLEADIADPESRRTHLTYSAQPVRGACQIQAAGKRVLGLLGQVRCPVLVAHGALDRVCPVSNADRVFRRLGSHDKRLLILPRSRHIITRDLERDRLARKISGLLQELSSDAG